MRVSRIAPLLSLLVLIAIPVSAQSIPLPTPATTRLAFTHDGLNTDGYKLQVDNDPRTVVTVSPLEGVPGDLVTPFPALTPGSHTLTIFAYKAGVDVFGTPVLTVTMFVVPNPPTNFRLIAMRAMPAALRPSVV